MNQALKFVLINGAFIYWTVFFSLMAIVAILEYRKKSLLVAPPTGPKRNEGAVLDTAMGLTIVMVVMMAALGYWLLYEMMNGPVISSSFPREAGVLGRAAQAAVYVPAVILQGVVNLFLTLPKPVLLAMVVFNGGFIWFARTPTKAQKKHETT